MVDDRELERGILILELRLFFFDVLSLFPPCSEAELFWAL
jgi:hypothetical protein